MLPKLLISWEKWKFNKEYGVWVSTEGHFKDIHKQPIPYKIYSENGYVYVKTKHGNKLAHRLVMLTWRPIEDREAFTVDHLNHNKRDCRLANLQWVTQQENTMRAQEDTLTNEDMMVTGPIKSITAFKSSSESYTFNDLTKATEWLKTNQAGTFANTTVDKMLPRVEKAARNRTSYGNYFWKCEV